MIILLDIDGVVLDFSRVYLKMLHEDTGRLHTENDITDFHFEKCVASVSENNAIWARIQMTPGLCYDIPMYAGASDFMTELRKLGRVVACTSPANPTWTAERAQWLLDNGFDRKDIVIASDKSLVYGDVLIDDAVHNVESWDGGMPILFTRPWNKNHRWFGASRADTYEDALYSVRTLND